ncbi:MAG: rhodanese-like domain-containing protein [Actinomycetota bacterium]
MASSIRIRRRGLVALVALAIVLLAACSESEEDSTGGVGATWTQITPNELDSMLQSEDVFLVNVHVPYEGHIPGTDAFIPYDRIAGRVGALPSDTSKLVIYCRSGTTSAIAAQALITVGVSGFYELAGGYNAWIAAGLPFETKRAAG